MTYANLPSRVKAAFIDAVVLIGAMYAITELFNLFGEIPTWLRILAWVSIFILYEPLLVSIYGGTMGHSYSKITVRREADSEKKIGFVMAVLRFVVKFFLGWISLLTVTGTEKKQAIHDHIVKSVVLEEVEE
ncbi:MAG: hypothetical protein Aureis2KO_15220 [Aureisphaera sp.]